MTREFPDELLSAYLDNELTSAERDQVERHLAESESARRLLAELRSVRQELSSLPLATVDPALTDRVLQQVAALYPAIATSSATVPSAAMTIADRSRTANAEEALPLRPNTRRLARWPAALAAGLLAVAASGLAGFWFWPGGENENLAANSSANKTRQAALPSGNAAARLRVALAQATPLDGEAIVLRLRVGHDLPLAAAWDAALAKAGIQSRLASDLSTGATSLVPAYRQKLLDAVKASSDAGNDLADKTIAASEALFIEAPLDQIESVFTQIAASTAHPLELQTEARLAFARGQGAEAEGEGEGGSATTAHSAAAGQPFVQRLNPTLFRLAKLPKSPAIGDGASAQSAANAPADAAGRGVLRVLILVERAGP